MSAREKLQSMLGATDEQMNTLLKNNAPDEIVERIVKLGESVKEKHPNALFGITPNYAMISVPPGGRGTKVVELLPKMNEVVVNVMKLPLDSAFQKGRPQYFRDLKDENGNPRINWYRLDYREESDFDTMLGAILDVYEQKLQK